MDSPHAASEAGTPVSRDMGMAPRTFFLLSVTALLVRTGEWMQADLWYDEVIALNEFVIGPPHAHGILWPLRFYPIPNNHILFSAIGWCWVRICRYNLTETLLRLPAIVFSIATLGVIVAGWRQWLGRRLAGIAAIAFAVSPVYSAFAYQFRGYSLTILLAALGVMATMDMLDGRLKRGTALHAAVALLLPLVVPTNSLLVFSHLCFLAWEAHRRQALRRMLPALGIVAGAGALGASYYLTIWPQFSKALQQTAGWDSAPNVFFNLCLAAVAHLGPLPLVCLVQTFRRLPQASPERVEPPNRQSLRIVVCCLVPVIALLLFSPSAPFPRVFLAFLPMLSFAILRSAADWTVWRSQPLILILGLVIMHAFIWERASTWLTNEQVMDGRHPQNLLQQHYRGSMALQQLCARARKDNLQNHLIVLTTAHDFPSFRYYWVRYGGGLETVIAENGAPQEALAAVMRDKNARLAAVAPNGVEAARLFGLAGSTSPFSALYYEPYRGLYIHGHVPTSGNRP